MHLGIRTGTCPAVVGDSSACRVRQERNKRHGRGIVPLPTRLSFRERLRTIMSSLAEQEPAGFAFSTLTPTAFLGRSAVVHGDRLAVVDGPRRFTYAEFANRSWRLAGALADRGVAPGDRVAVLAANSHVMLECHNGVPMAGGVLVPLNVRLSSRELSDIARHSGAETLICTDEFADLAGGVAAAMGATLIDESTYNESVAAAEPMERLCADERGLLAINYTSGTTGAPRGAMYHHRGAYLQSLAMALHSGLGPGSRYLWTLPMFHCDGWCFTWAVTAAGAVHVCQRRFTPQVTWRALQEDGVTHFSAAPTVLTMLAEAVEATPLLNPVAVQTGGAPPGPALLNRLKSLGFEVTHLYGLTETFGPVAINDWHPEWDGLDVERQAVLAARQGVGNVVADRLRVLDESRADVPADGVTIGEIAVRGNDVMLGYYRDPEGTAEVTLCRDDGVYLRTGDLAVRHSDGYLEIRDRAKDVIISGGENISSVEVERVLGLHPAVLESAVVGAPDDRWGEVPVAYLTLRQGAEWDQSAVVAFMRERLAGFKVPKRFIVDSLPKTSTGKIQKSLLRERQRASPP